MDKFDLGKRIEKLRCDSYMTQEQFGNLLEVSSKTVSKWEHGTSEPPLSILCKIAELFNITLEELLGFKKIKKNYSKEKNNSYRELFDVILIAVSLASGVCLVVTAILKEIDFYSAFALVGLGISCVSAYLLRKIK